LQALRRDPLGAQMTGHLLILEHLAGILPLPGRTVAAMRDRNAVGRAEAAEIVALHRAGEALADAGAGHIDILPGQKMRRGDLGATSTSPSSETRNSASRAFGSTLALAKWPRCGLVTFLTLAAPTPSCSAV